MKIRQEKKKWCISVPGGGKKKKNQYKTNPQILSIFYNKICTQKSFYRAKKAPTNQNKSNQIKNTQHKNKGEKGILSLITVHTHSHTVKNAILNLIESKYKWQNLTKYCLIYISKEDLFEVRALAVSVYKHLFFCKYIFKSLNITAVQNHTYKATYICETQLPSSQSHMEANQLDYYEDQDQKCHNIIHHVKSSILVHFLLLYHWVRYMTKYLLN